MRGRWPTDPRRYRWIVDGHNAIFAHPELERLQTGDERAEARRRLEGMFDRLASGYGIEILIVYDGNRITRNPDARRDGRIRTQYSSPPDEEADDRILYLVQDAIRNGSRPAVVSSDRATLGARLPRGVLQVDPSEVFRRLRSRRGGRNGSDRPPGDFSDIEAHFLSFDDPSSNIEAKTGDDPQEVRDEAPRHRSKGRRPSGGARSDLA